MEGPFHEHIGLRGKPSADLDRFRVPQPGPSPLGLKVLGSSRCCAGAQLVGVMDGVCCQRGPEGKRGTVVTLLPD